MHFYPVKNVTKGTTVPGFEPNVCHLTGSLGADATESGCSAAPSDWAQNMDFSGYHTAMQEMSDNDDDNNWGASDDEEAQEDPSEEELDRLFHLVRSDFAEYCQKASNFTPFSKRMKDAVQLMRTLRATKASLQTYDAVMEWHLKATGVMAEHASAGSCPEFITRKAVFKFLRRRYNMETGYNNITSIVLPSSANRAKIVWNNAHKVIGRLLTDPRIRPEDYLFWANDPFREPPKRLNYIADLNTGKCYTDTWKELITKPGVQVLLPTPLYIDGTATGQFANLPITPVKISLGIFKREARDKAHAWGILGYIPSIIHSVSRGRQIMIDSGHVDGTIAYHQSLENEGVLQGRTSPKAQDLHTILDVILKEYVMLQKSGIIWDLFYNGKLYKDVKFIPFVPFIKADTEEADKLCGKYLSRGRNVAHLCRYCHCPTDQSDNPLAHFPLKTKNEIQSMINNDNLDGLKAISQHCIQNTLYKLHFGSHNKLSVHGACAWDMLHMILLGIFKYIRDCFFEQIGETSSLAKEIDALARQYGELLSRQSDRQLPKTKFNNGITGGKLAAKEYTGVLLLIFTVLKSKKGRQLARKKGLFKNDQVVYDWCLLLETVITWEGWLKSPSMERRHVNRAEKKHRYLMYLIKKVARRGKGMGLKVTKFHAILHLVQDMKNFGVPLEVDCGSNEQHHDNPKASAKLTQKKKESFDQQTAERLQEKELLEMANEEFEGRPLWDYWNGYHYNAKMEVPPAPPEIGGGAYRCVQHPQTGHYSFVHARNIGGKSGDVMVEQPLINFVAALQYAVRGHVDSLQLHTVHKRDGVIFRGNMSFIGTVWPDWVLVDWGDDGGLLPCKIWGFVDLKELPEATNINYGGVVGLGKGVYAIVEATIKVNEGKSIDSTVIDLDADTELVTYLETEIGHETNGFIDELKFYLADVEAFHEPAVVVPDIGGNNNGYIWIENPDYWPGLFETWLDANHSEDVMVGSDEEDEESEDDDDSLDEEVSQEVEDESQSEDDESQSDSD